MRKAREERSCWREANHRCCRVATPCASPNSDEGAPGEPGGSSSGEADPRPGGGARGGGKRTPPNALPRVVQEDLVEDGEETHRPCTLQFKFFAATTKHGRGLCLSLGKEGQDEAAHSSTSSQGRSSATLSAPNAERLSNAVATSIKKRTYRTGGLRGASAVGLQGLDSLCEGRLPGCRPVRHHRHCLHCKPWEMQGGQERLGKTLQPTPNLRSTAHPKKGYTDVLLLALLDAFWFAKTSFRTGNTMAIFC